MAEAFAVVGLASAIIQFVEFGSKVVKRLHAFHEKGAEASSVFHSIETRLPLILDLVRQIQHQMKAGKVDELSQNVMLPVVQSCLLQVQQLDNLLNKALPQHGDSSWYRGKKAVLSVIREAEIQKFDQALATNCELLVQTSTLHSISNLESQEPVTTNTAHLQQLINVIVPSQQTISHLPQSEGATPTKPVFMMPFERDARFLGRRDILDEISSRFKECNQVALAGLGGVGKSQIAIEYSYIFKGQHPEAHVFWIYASTATRFEQCYQEIARRLMLPGWEDKKIDNLKLVYEWLSDENNGKWLMLVDNADDASNFFQRPRSFSANTVARDGTDSKPLARYLPRSPNGYVLVTTRDKRVGERLAGREKPIEVSTMKPSDALNLLRSRIYDDDWSVTDAMRLIEDLACLPLAVTQAAAFISENSLTVSDYLELLHSGDTDLMALLSNHLEDPRRDMDTENSVIRTWKLSFDQISKGTPRAGQILSLLAVLDYHGAPRMLLRKNGESEFDFRTALGALQAFSLITAGKGKDGACRMHRLVAISTQKWLELTGTLSHWRSEALKVLSENFPEQQTYENWPLLEALTPHSQLVFSFEFSDSAEQLQYAKLIGSAALYDLSKGRYSAAYQKSIKSLDTRHRLLPADHRLTLDSAQILGETLLHRGEFESAKSMLGRAIVGREKLLGELHPDTLESMSDLTITLLEMNDIDAAEVTALRAFHGRKQVLGDEHPDTLVSLNILSMLHQRQGNLSVAKEMCETVLEGRQRILGHSHPDTLMTLNNLAVLHYRQGDLSAASSMLQRVLVGEKEVLGPESYDIQVSLSNMALIHAEQGSLDQAEDLHRAVLAMRELTVGSDHPATLFSAKNLAEVLTKKGDLDEAESLNKRVANGRTRTMKDAGALLLAGLLFD
ncbi:hypothetical protein BDV19DRAFT_360121 [Aspergillus venezuelensis]